MKEDEVPKDIQQGSEAEVRPLTPKRRFGALRGRVSLGPEFFEPLPESETDA